MLPALLCACLLGGPTESETVAVASSTVDSNVKPLAFAYRDGDVAVEGRSFSGYSIVSLEIRNRRSQDIDLDVNGSYLQPEVRTIQRLGIGLVRAGHGDTTIRVRPRGKVELKVLSVCMDHSKGSPDERDRFELSKELAPEGILEALQQWKEHPSIEQGSVQSTVWGRAPVLSPPTPPPALRFPAARDVLSVDQQVFVRTADGRLFHGDPRQPLEHVPGTVLGLWGGRQLFGLRRIPAKDLPYGVETVVSRFDLETSGWVDLPLKPIDGDLKWVSKRETEALVLSPVRDLVHVSEEGPQTLVTNVRHLQVSESGVTYLVLQGADRELYRLASKREAVRVYEHPFPIRDLTLSRGAPCMVDTKGTVITLDSGGPKRLRGAARFVRSLGHGILVGSSDESNLFFRTRGQLHFYMPGAKPLEFGYPGRGSMIYLSDSARGSILCLDETWMLREYRPGPRQWVPVAALEPQEEDTSQ